MDKVLFENYATVIVIKNPECGHMITNKWNHKIKSCESCDTETVGASEVVKSRTQKHKTPPPPPEHSITRFISILHPFFNTTALQKPWLWLKEGSTVFQLNLQHLLILCAIPTGKKFNLSSHTEQRTEKPVHSKLTYNGILGAVVVTSIASIHFP